MPMLSNSYNAIQYNHSLSSQIAEISAPLLDNFNITTFAHIKIFKDGLLHFTNNQKWLEFYCNQGWYESSHYQKEMDNLIGNDTHIVLRKDTASLTKAMHNYDVWHGLSVYKKYDSHIEMWNFATTKENVGIYNLYLNNLSYLERFIVYFQNKAKDLIEPKGKDILLKRRQGLILNNKDDQFKDAKKQFLIDTKLKKLHLQGLHISISSREIQCLHLLSNGNTLKEVAIILNLSPRTIETYIVKLKSKTKCYFKHDLIAYYRKYLRNYFISELEN